jgi:iron complex outermembrane receptor protein
MINRSGGNRVWSVVLATACGLIFTISALAQQAPEEGTKPQDQTTEGSLTPAGYTEIVVTAPRMGIPYKEAPGATTVVGDDTLQAMPKGISAGEALPLVPGVKIDTQFDSEKVHISIRGQGILTEYGIRGIEVLLDGIPLNDPSGFAADLYDVDWSTVQRVEVIRGPSGSFYGGGSSAGVINIITKDGHSDPERANLSAEGGSYQFWKALGEVSGFTDKTDYRFSASRTMGDGNRDHSAFYGTNFYGKARFVVNSSFQLTAVIMGTSYFQENPEGLNAQQVAENPDQANPDSGKMNEYQLTRRLTAGLSGTAKLASNQDLSFTVYGRKTDYTESVPSTVQYRTIYNPGAMAQYTFHSGTGSVRNHLSFGADAGWQSIDLNKRPNLGGGQPAPYNVTNETISQDGVGVYVMDRLEWGKGWAAMFNYRYDNIHNDLNDKLKFGGMDLSGSRSFSQPTGRVGLTWNPRPDLGFYAAWGQGFMPPATEEIVANPVQQGGFNNVIQPATSMGEEIGVRGTRGKFFSYEATAFYLHTVDDFERYRVPSRPLETFYGNAGNTRRFGLETAIGLYPTENLAIRASYTFNHFTYLQIRSKVFPTAVPGNSLPNSPQHLGYLDMQYTFTPHWVVAAGLDCQSQAFVDATNVPYIGGYTLYHARVAYQWHTTKTRGEFMISGTNLSDKKYIAFTEPDPDGNSYQPGPGRQWFAGVRVWFGGK